MEHSFSPAAAPRDPAVFWEQRTRQVRHLLNATWLLEAGRPVVFLASVVATAVVLLGRRQGWELRWLAWLPVGLLLVALVASFLRARAHFVSHPAARAEIESTLRLHSRLSAAAAGVGPWPETARWRPALWQWQWRRLLLLPLCSAALVAAAFLLPLLPTSAPQPPPLVKPPVLEKIDDMLEKLAQTPQLNQETVEAMQQEAEQLARQDPADWYSHASLEAADHLQGKLQAGLQTLGEQTSKLQKLLGQNANEAGAAWQEQLQGALSALEGNVPRLNGELSEALSKLDPAQFKTLSAEQLEKLRDSLEKAREGAGATTKNDGEASEESGEGDESEEGEGMGNGGVDRGPGTGRLKLGQKPTNLSTKETEALGSEDFRHAALGEALGTSAGQHEVDRTKEYRAKEGGAAVAGEGAAALWRQQNVTPEERRRLQEFFK